MMTTAERSIPPSSHINETSDSTMKMRLRIRDDCCGGIYDDGRSRSISNKKTYSPKNLFVRFSSPQIAVDLIRRAHGHQSQEYNEYNNDSNCQPPFGGGNITNHRNNDEDGEDDMYDDQCWLLPSLDSVVNARNEMEVKFLPLRIEMTVRSDPNQKNESNVNIDNISEGASKSKTGSTTKTVIIYASYNGGICQQQRLQNSNQQIINTIEIPRSILHSVRNGNDDVLEELVDPTVSVSVVPVVPYATRVEMEPATTNDWELLEINSQIVEYGGLLNQLTVIFKFQHLSIHVGNDTINMIVRNVSTWRDEELSIVHSVWPTTEEEDDTNSANDNILSPTPNTDCAMLIQNTEVVVTPKPRRKRQGIDSPAWSGPFRLIPTANDWGENALGVLCTLSDSDPIHVFDGCILISDEMWDFDTDWASISKGDIVDDQETPLGDTGIDFTLLRVIRSSTIAAKDAALSTGMRLASNLSLWSDLIRLRPVWDPMKLAADDIVCSRLRVFVGNEDMDRSAAAWKRPDIDVSYPTLHCSVSVAKALEREPREYPLGTIMAYSPDQNGSMNGPVVIFQIMPVHSSVTAPAYVNLERKQLINLCEERGFNEEGKGHHGSFSLTSSPHLLIPLETVSSPWAQVAINAMKSGGSALVLHGNPGNGKTHTATLLASIHSFDTKLPVFYLDCKNLVKARPQMMGLLGEMDSFFRGVFDRGDGIVVLDDVDQLAPNTFGKGMEDASSKMESTNPTAIDQSKLLADRLAQYLEALLDTGNRNGTPNNPKIIFTCKDLESIHPSVFLSNLYFPTPLQLPLFTTNDRMKILAIMIRRHVPGGTLALEWNDFRDFDADTDGFYPRDLEKISLRVGHAIQVHASYDRPLDVTAVQNSLRSCLPDFVPLAQLAAGKSRSKSASNWSDIGGLFGVKIGLESTILYPGLFGKIYKSSSVRLPRGILLFGPSGCGKSLIVPALAKHCNLPLVTCRGPEILDKYIGASEAKVRQLFERASQLAPSILFLDELDALAPRRGSDATGVTDRVVNQLLTYLDGVEDTSSDSRGTVYIIGATSRPDKIDPALIRPGRLEQHLFVGPPETDDEWRDLLVKISKSWVLTSECNDYLLGDHEVMQRIHSAGRLCPADIRAVFDTAQLNAVHAALKTVQSPDQLDTVSITVPDLKLAFQETRPSLQEAEAKFLQAIYMQFRGSQGRTREEHVDDESDAKTGIRLKTSLR